MNAHELIQQPYYRTGLCVSGIHLLVLVVLAFVSFKPATELPKVLMAQLIDIQSEHLNERVVLRRSTEKVTKPVQKMRLPQAERGTQPVRAVQEKTSSEASAPVFMPNPDSTNLNNPKPPYPFASRELGETGRTVLRVCVSEHGDAESVELDKSSGYNRLDVSAINTVKRWRFIPAHKAGVNIPMCYRLPINFRLEG